MRDIVINTGPIIAAVAATGSLEWLPSLYGRIVIPYEVVQEIEAGGPGNPEILCLRAISERVQIGREKTTLDAALLRELDPGEASVICSALTGDIDTVAIDEKAGRRIARIRGLNVTGSLGMLLKAKQHGAISSLGACVARMRSHGIWISEDLVAEALRLSNET